MRVDQFDFELPDDRIALTALEPRDAARMLVVPSQGPFADAVVTDLPSYLKAGDVLVVNDTRVINAALAGIRLRDERAAKVAFNLTRREEPDRWRAFARPAKRLNVGDDVTFAGAEGLTLSAIVTAKGENGDVALRFNCAGADLDAAIAAVGTVPLPPYIALKRALTRDDAARYQTVFADKPGAVAAPTAGLHFTPELLARLNAMGVSTEVVTLHVGAGTFLPVKADDTRDHVMHAEWGDVSAETAAALNEARRRGGRVVAVGTTALRILESAASADGVVRPFRGETSIFITPGYRFRVVDILMTNFHLPRSTLFMLVAAFSGLDRMRSAYGHAINEQYRFYSYGDASLLFRA